MARFSAVHQCEDTPAEVLAPVPGIPRRTGCEFSAHFISQFGKAGAMRWRGIRPTVRGVAMNPIDHPHGGGEGRTGTQRDPVSPWGKLTKGYRTRNYKRTNSMIVQRRRK